MEGGQDQKDSLGLTPCVCHLVVLGEYLLGIPGFPYHLILMSLGKKCNLWGPRFSYLSSGE